MAREYSNVETDIKVEAVKNTKQKEQNISNLDYENTKQRKNACAWCNISIR